MTLPVPRGGGTVTVALLKVDLVGGTKLKEKYAADEPAECLRLYQDAVNRLVHAYGGTLSPFQGNGATAYFRGPEAVESAVQVALGLLEDVRTLPKYELHVRTAVGVDDLPPDVDEGRAFSQQFNLAGHAEKVCPPDSVAITEETYLALEEKPEIAARFECHGTTRDDGAMVYVAPRGRPRKADDLFLPRDADPAIAKASLTSYYRSPEFRDLRFRGVRQFDRVGVAVDLRKAFVELRARRWRSETWREPAEPWEDDDQRRHRRPGRAREPAAGDSAPGPVREKLLLSRRLIVLGDPGSGKTTFLRWLALVACDGVRSVRRHLGVDEALVPLFVPVASLWEAFQRGQRRDPIDALAEHFAGLAADVTAPRLRTLLDRGEALVLLDGLDEFTDAGERAAAASLVGRLMTSVAPRNRFVISSRIMGYAPLAGAEVETVVLEPLAAPEAKDLAARFYQALGGQGKISPEEQALDLVGQLSGRDRLHPFVTNPLLLTLAAIVHAQLGKLPRYRARLYDVACQTLVDAWAHIRRTANPQPTKEHIDYEVEGLRVLPALALWIHRERAGGLVPREELLEQIAALLPKAQPDRTAAAKQFLDGLSRAGALLMDRGGDRWGFAHRTFQEYLVAKALARSKDPLAGVKKRLYDPAYAEVWRLMAGEISVVQQRSDAAAEMIRLIHRDRDGFHAKLLRKNVILAAGCLSDSVIEDDELREAVVKDLARLVKAGSPLPPSNVLQSTLRQLSGTPEGALCVAFLRDGLGASSAAVRIRTVYALAQLEAKELALRIAELLTDPDEDVRGSAVEALGAFGAREMAPRIAELLNDPTSLQRSRAAEVLGVLGAKELALPIAELLRDPDQGVRWVAAGALGALGAEDLAPRIAKMLDDPQAQVRSSAVEALQELEARELAPRIMEMLRDPDGQVRSSAAEALGALQARHLAPRIAEMLKDPHEAVRSSAAEALGALDAKDLVPRIAEMLEDPEKSIRSSAAKALAALEARELAPRIAELLKDMEVVVRWNAVRALGAVEAKELAPRIAEMLEDPDARVRSVAASALGALEARELVPRIVEMLKDTDADVRWGALRALGALDAKEQVPRIAEMLKDPKGQFRSQAASVLAELGAKEQAPRIAALLKDGDPNVQIGAASAVAALDYTAAIPTLRALMAKAKHPEVAWAAAEALWSLSHAQGSRPRARPGRGARKKRS